MATGTAGSAARKTHMQVMHTMAFDVNYNDAGIASGVNTGKVLPAGAVISGKVTTIAFDNGTPRVTIQTSGGQTISGISPASISQIREGE